jgi:hypothetical protein
VEAHAPIQNGGGIPLKTKSVKCITEPTPMPRTAHNPAPHHNSNIQHPVWGTPPTAPSFTRTVVSSVHCWICSASGKANLDKPALPNPEYLKTAVGLAQPKMIVGSLPQTRGCLGRNNKFHKCCMCNDKIDPMLGYKHVYARLNRVSNILLRHNTNMAWTPDGASCRNS